jgi:hypothetical protein
VLQVSAPFLANQPLNPTWVTTGPVSQYAITVSAGGVPLVWSTNAALRTIRLCWYWLSLCLTLWRRRPVATRWRMDGPR